MSTEIQNASNSPSMQFGIVLETAASTLTQGGRGYVTEGPMGGKWGSN